MSSSRQLSIETRLVEAMGDLVQTYEQIYVSKIQQVRDNVVGTRHFIEGLSTVYKELKLAYGQEILLREKKHLADVNPLALHGEVVVLITTNKRLSGDINQKVFSYFMDYIANKDVKLMIVGQIGKELYQQRGGKKEYMFFSLPEDDLSIVDLQAAVEYLLHYDKVTVFHGRYKNLMIQQESKSSLTGEYDNVGAGLPTEEVRKEIRKFLFEPGPREILEFFQKHIFGSLFQQTTQEANLAQMGSRIVAMEAATGNIQQRLKSLASAKRKLVKRKKNKKQLQALSGMSFWFKKGNS